MTVYIHALREEGDLFPAFDAPFKHPISIHALREEGDRCRRYTSGSGGISILLILWKQEC